MWSILGVLTLAWLGVGFISGLKMVYIDGFVEYVNEQIDSGEVELPDELSNSPVFESVRHSKPFFLAMFTLMGFELFGKIRL